MTRKFSRRILMRLMDYDRLRKRATKLGYSVCFETVSLVDLQNEVLLETIKHPEKDLSYLDTNSPAGVLAALTRHLYDVDYLKYVNYQDGDNHIRVGHRTNHCTERSILGWVTFENV